MKTKILISISLVIILILFSYYFENTSMSVIGKEVLIPIYSVDTPDKKIALSFDVNWAEKDNLYSILDILDKYNINATFFIIGAWVEYEEENVAKLKAISERGHEIGNHSYKHPSFTKISEQKIKEELKKTSEVIKKYTDKEIKLFRFPSGDYNVQSYRTVLEEGYIGVQWSVDSVDWKESGEEIEYIRVKKNIKPGSIVLFHNNAKYTPKNLEKIIKECINEGYTFVKIGELIYENEFYVDENGIKHKKIKK